MNIQKYLPNIGKTRVEHYYGDPVRVSLVTAAVVSFLALPVYGEILHLGTTTQILCGLLLVLLAGLTNPHSKTVVLLDGIVTGAGAFLLELTAISYYAIDSAALLLLREFEAVMLLVAFYYSVKTARAMFLRQVGKPATPSEFSEPTP